MQIIVKMKFGSHLYGTNTPDSDTDYKGVYLPSKTDIYLSRYKKTISTSTGAAHSKNNKNDIDTEIFSLQQFIKLATEGQTVAIDMLHAPQDMILESSFVWDMIIDNRKRFYTKNLQAFMGYCKRQAAKYGIKGSRLADAKAVFEYLSSFPAQMKMRTVWDDLPSGNHIEKHEPNEEYKLGYYQVCGKKYFETVQIGEVINSISIFMDKYGSRAKLSAQNMGVDWKAMSHALRAAYELEQIYTEHTLTFPLKQSQFLTDVKLGKYEYKIVVNELERMIERVEVLAVNSDFPDKVDTGFWDHFLVYIISNYAFDI